MPHATRREFLAAGAGALAASSAEAQPSRPPNILILFPDQHRFDWLGGPGEIPVRTPVADALAARGVRFERAWCASPLCAPSRACLAAGMEYGRCRVPGNGFDFPLDQPTFYRLLRDSGYHVMGNGKFDLHKATEYWGVDGKRLLPEWGFSDGIDSAGKFDAIRSGSVHPRDPYMAYLHAQNLVRVHVDDLADRTGARAFENTDPTPLPDHAYGDNWIGKNAAALVRDAPAGEPWFLQVNFVGPHDPLDITESMAPLYAGAEDFPLPNGGSEYDDAKYQQMRRNYSAMVENIDRWCGKILEEVEKRGELDNTVVFLSSDHGEMLGDHNRWRKRVPYEASVGVPLIAAGPGVREGHVSQALVSVMDLAATSLDYAGLKVPADMDSRSMRPVLSGETDSHREILFSGLEPWRAVTDGRFKLVRGFDASIQGYYSSRDTPAYADVRDRPPLLFDVEADRLERENLADKAPGEVQRLSALLA